MILQRIVLINRIKDIKKDSHEDDPETNPRINRSNINIQKNSCFLQRLIMYGRNGKRSIDYENQTEEGEEKEVNQYIYDRILRIERLANVIG